MPVSFEGSQHQGAAQLNKFLQGQEVTLQSNPLYSAKSQDLPNHKSVQPWFLCPVNDLAEVHEVPNTPSSPFRKLRPGSVPFGLPPPQPERKPVPREELSRSTSAPQLQLDASIRSEPCSPDALVRTNQATVGWGNFPWLAPAPGSLLQSGGSRYMKCAPSPSRMSPHASLYKTMGASQTLGASQTMTPGSLPGRRSYAGFHHDHALQHSFDNVTTRNTAHMSCCHARPQSMGTSMRSQGRR
mmetsp:Transcript_9344/g.24109  ORF Transcript_9344/g.24109 Transcript_9344/m.24109 type:complete len:242 (-) Transcript_9344:93-818(-)